MPGIFIDRAHIKNYKCIVDETISFAVPNGKAGSGLNILIGENATGKTSILECVSMVAQSGFSIENRVTVNDFFDFKEPISIDVTTGNFRCKTPYAGNYYDSNGINVTIKVRDRKSPGKLLSSSINASSSFKPTTPHYFNSKDEPSKEIIPYYTIFDDDKIEGDGLNVFYFDKSRNRQLTAGTYKTTFERICDDLNWRFAKELKPEILEEIINNITGQYFESVRQVAQKGIGKKLASEFSDFFSEDIYKNLQIDLLNLLSPYENAFFSVRLDNELKQIKTKSLGSGVEMILTLLLLRSISKESKGSIVYLIDEPELHLHPKAQSKLVDILLNESKDKQIVVSTHSPYIFKNCLREAGSVSILQRDKQKLSYQHINEGNWGLFPWSPSWGEINYVAFHLPTVEFHNELFGFLQKESGATNLTEFDMILSELFGIKLDRVWKKDTGDGKQAAVSLSTYIRNSIHHPENKLNAPFTESDLKTSIEKMIHVRKSGLN